MNNKSQNIEDLFSKAFDGARETPPESVWQNIEKQLDESNVDGLFKGAFENNSIEPPVGMWAKIQQNLWMKDFMRFTPNQINIYYTSIVAVVAGVGLFLSTNKERANQDNTNKPTRKEIQISNKNNNAKQILSNTSVSTTKNSIIENAVSSNAENKTTQNNSYNKNNQVLQRISSNQPANIPTNQYIVGDTTICTGTECRYQLHGDISNACIKWDINAKNATIENIAKNIIALTANKAGSYILRAEILNSGSKHTVEFTIKVVDAETPQIIGNAKVCQGTQAQFKIASSKYIGKMYSWNVAINSFNHVTSGVILVDCKNAGYDTIRLNDINTKTNCAIRAIVPITIYPKPEADFKITDNGGGLIDLYNTSKCGDKAINCKQTIKWFVSDQTYTKNNISIEFSDNGIYSATLEVQNEFNCKETIKKDITIDIQNLFVPNAFVPGNDNGSFIPKGENLASYTVEIFDASNRKLWESSQLVDGRPSEGWDGLVDGQVMPSGTYFWKISATFKDGTKWKGAFQKGRYQTFGTLLLLKK